MNDNPNANDIESLNLGELDIEQLEQRIELGHSLPHLPHPHPHPDSYCIDNHCTDYVGNAGCKLDGCVGNECIGYAAPQ